MQKILKTLERVYGNPVDIEYTVNTDETGEFVVNLLQCRPLYVGKEEKQITIEREAFREILFELKDSSMGASVKRPLDLVVQVDPVKYYQYPYRKKYDVAAAVGKINRYYKGKEKNLLLMVPGRLGTSSPELGVPVVFGDISGFCAICEVSDSRAGYMPELSYGSHMFQDMVEANMIYGALWNDEKTITYQPEILEHSEDLFEKICPEDQELKGMIRVWETEGLEYWLDAASNHALCGWV